MMKGNEIMVAGLPTRDDMERRLAVQGINGARTELERGIVLIATIRLKSSQPNRRAFAQRVLEHSPLCVAAWLMLAEGACGEQERIELCRLAQTAGDLLLEFGVLARGGDAYWRSREILPYLQAKALLADSLWRGGSMDEALDIYADLFEKDPLYALGLRHQYASRLLEAGRLEALRGLVAAFENDPTLETYAVRLAEAERRRDVEALDACADYLAQLQLVLRPQFTEHQWSALFSSLETPEQVARRVLRRAPLLQAQEPQFWKLLDLSTEHITPEDHALLGGYRGPDWRGERDRDIDQTLFVTPCVGGWIVSTSGCAAPRPTRLLSASGKAELAMMRREVLARMRREGFSEAFIGVFRYAYDNGVSDIRFDRDADFVPHLSLFDAERGVSGCDPASKPSCCG